MSKGLGSADLVSELPSALDASTEAPTVSLRNVSVVYDETTVLGPLDWDIAPHERWIVLGPQRLRQDQLGEGPVALPLPDHGHRGGAR